MCKKEKTLYVTKLYNKRLYIRSVDNKDCLWGFASGHSPFLQSGVLFAAPQTLPHPLGNQRGAVTPTEPTGRKHPQLNVGTWLKLTWHGTSPTAPKGSLCRLRYPGQPCPGPAPWESIMVQCSPPYRAKPPLNLAATSQIPGCPKSGEVCLSTKNNPRFPHLLPPSREMRFWPKLKHSPAPMRPLKYFLTLPESFVILGPGSYSFSPPKCL